MSTLSDLQSSISALSDTILAIDTKLDEVRSRIEALVVGAPVSQEQLDALNASLEAVKSAAAAVLTEADDLA
ncbi:MAG: hypothetical protein K2X87_19235 [Gemmataceae bacterium]|nr:hypothetical protein [Gemmataceae bacterium]